MHWHFTPYILPLFIIAAILTFIARAVWRRHPTPGAMPGALLILGVAEWSLGYALELGSPELSAKLFWTNVNFVGIVTVPVMWFIFVLQYTHHDLWLTRRNLTLLAIPSLVTLALAWTNDAHGLIRSSAGLDTSGPIPLLDPTYSVGFWVFWGYAFLLTLIGSALMLYALKTSPGLYRGQSVALLLSALVPWIGNVIYLFDLNPLYGLDLTPFSFTIAGLIMAWGLFHYRLFDVVPVARDAIIEGMSDGVIVLDAQNRIVDLNPAAGRIIGQTVSEMIGQPVAQVFAEWPDLVESYQNVQETHAEIAVSTEGGRRHFDLIFSPLRNWRGRLVGRLIVLRDISERVQMEAAWRDAEKRYRTIFEQSPDAIVLLDPATTRSIEFNDMLSHLLGYSAQEFAEMQISDYEVLEDRAEIQAHIDQVLQGGRDEFETKMRAKDGSVRDVLVSIRVIELEGRPTFHNIFRDITERVQTETALRRYAERLEVQHELDRAILSAESMSATVQAVLRHIRGLVSCKRISVFGIDPLTNTIDLLGAQREDGTYREPAELAIPLANLGLDALGQRRTRLITDATVLPPGSMAREMMIKHDLKDWLAVPLQVQDQLIGLLNLEVAGSDALTAEDLDIIQEVADSLAVALRQAWLYAQTQEDARIKADLLQEVNHRVHNNLTAIIGLLHAERLYAPPQHHAVVGETLGHLIQRIEGLAQVHRMLSQSQWAPIRLDELVIRIIQIALNALPRDQMVRVDVTPSPVTVSPRQASSLALMVNELATNTIKHGMVGRTLGQVTVHISEAEDDMILLTYWDDGPGYPEAVLDMQQDDVGLHLIRQLTQTLQGTFMLTNDGGAIATITFKGKERNET